MAQVASGPVHVADSLIGGEPLYERCVAVLAAQIRSGSLPPGGRLQSERALADALGFARLTVRRALFALRDAGLIEPAATRGWQVSAGPVSEPPNTLISFSEMARDRGLVASSRPLRVEQRPASVDESEALRIAPGASVLHVRRLRLLNNEPIAVETMQISLAVAPWLVDYKWLGSFYEQLEEHGVEPYRSMVTVDVAGADHDDAELLGVEPGCGLLRVSGVTLARDGTPICIERVHYHPQRYRFRAVLERDAAAASAAPTTPAVRPSAAGAIGNSRVSGA